MLTVPIHVLPHGIGLDLPEHATSHSAGLDVRAAIPVDHEWVIAPGERKLVPTGLILGLPDGYEGQIRPRSGLALRHGVTVLNSPGTIDADYRGEVQVLLINHGQTAFELRRGERIAQLVVAPYQQVKLHGVGAEDLSETSRGAGGYGSTGKA